MKQHELQTPADWINSHHHPEQQRAEPDPEIDQDIWEDIISLQNQADTAISIAMFLGGILIMVLLVAYIMWVNGLIIH
jgi:hypothetical protein